MENIPGWVKQGLVQWSGGAHLPSFGKDRNKPACWKCRVLSLLSDKQNYFLLKSKIICFSSVRCGDVHRKQIFLGKWRQDFLRQVGRSIKGEEGWDAAQLVLITQESEALLDRPTLICHCKHPEEPGKKQGNGTKVLRAPGGLTGKTFSSWH